MKILVESETSMGEKYVLVDCGNNFYAHGTEKDLVDKWGFPVDNCGTKEEVLNHCKSISKLCSKYINDYKGYMEKDHCKDWEILINANQKEYEALNYFVDTLEKCL